MSVLDALDSGKDITDSIVDFISIDPSLKITMAAPLKRRQFKMASLEKINPEDAEYMTSYQVFCYLDEKDPDYNNITATMVEKIKQSNVLYNVVGKELEDKVINQNRIDL